MHSTSSAAQRAQRGVCSPAAGALVAIEEQLADLGWLGEAAVGHIGQAHRLVAGVPPGSRQRHRSGTQGSELLNAPARAAAAEGQLPAAPRRPTTP